MMSFGSVMVDQHGYIDRISRHSNAHRIDC